MTRPLRVDIADGWYHVTSRGVNKQALFLSDLDRRFFLRLLDKCSRRYGLEIHAYALMGNHYHLLLRTSDPNLSAAMHFVNCTYAIRFNSVHGRTGPAFERRFFSTLVDSERYLHAVGRYIHRNPVEAHLVPNAEGWKWSSMAAVTGQSKRPRWLTVDELRRGFPSRSAYVEFVDGSPPGVPQYERGPDTDVPIVGTGAFVEAVLDKHGWVYETAAGASRVRPRPTLADIEALVVEVLGVVEEDLRTSRRGVFNRARALACLLGREASGASLGEIADRFGYGSYHGVAASNRRVLSRLTSDSSLRTEVDLLYSALEQRASQVA